MSAGIVGYEVRCGKEIYFAPFAKVGGGGLRRRLEAEPIVRTPPLLCIEILSRDDRMSEMQERVDDYLAMGVENVWVVDPRRRRAYALDREGGLKPAPEALTIGGTAIEISIAEVFAELDEMERQL